MDDFGREVAAQIPRLRRYARALARDTGRADDLVQDCLARAVAKRHLFQPGTDLRAWLFTMLHNQYVNYVRRSANEGTKTSVDEIISLSVDGSALTSLELKDLEKAVARLPIEQRQAILLVGLEGMTYEEVANILNVPVGTVRSRISRGRALLRFLIGITDEKPPDTAALEPRSTPNPRYPSFAKLRRSVA